MKVVGCGFIESSTPAVLRFGNCSQIRPPELASPVAQSDGASLGICLFVHCSRAIQHIGNRRSSLVGRCRDSAEAYPREAANSLAGSDTIASSTHHRPVYATSCLFFASSKTCLRYDGIVVKDSACKRVTKFSSAKSSPNTVFELHRSFAAIAARSGNASEFRT